MLDCKFPDTGITVHPSGSLHVCCNIKKGYSEGSHISDVKDLEEYFYSSKMNKWRGNFSNGWENFPGCGNCKFHKTYKSSLPHDRVLGLQFLEMSTSNVCNQSCVMCKSAFSSKWRKLETLFDRTPQSTYSFSDSDIEKVLKLLPRLNKFMLKGGEPFADENNIKILSTLVQVNPDCEVKIISNGQRVSKGFLNVLSKLNNLFLGISIDALGKRYEWIRGGDFLELEDTIKTLSNLLGRQLGTIPTANIYNWFHMDELKSYIEDSPYLQLGSKWPSQIVTDPDWCSPQKLLHQEDLDIYSIKLKSEYSEEAVKQHIKYTKVMNGVRGFDVDIQGKML